MLAFLNGERWTLHVALICVSLVAERRGHFFLPIFVSTSSPERFLLVLCMCLVECLFGGGALRFWAIYMHCVSIVCWISGKYFSHSVQSLSLTVCGGFKILHNPVWWFSQCPEFLKSYTEHIAYPSTLKPSHCSDLTLTSVPLWDAFCMVWTIGMSS